MNRNSDQPEKELAVSYMIGEKLNLKSRVTILNIR